MDQIQGSLVASLMTTTFCCWAIANGWPLASEKDSSASASGSFGPTLADCLAAVASDYSPI